MLPTKIPIGLERSYMRLKANQRGTTKDLLDSYLRNKKEKERDRILTLEEKYVQRQEYLRKIESAVNEVRQEHPELLGILLFGSTANTLDRTPNDVDAILIFKPNTNQPFRRIGINPGEIIFGKLNLALQKYTGKQLHDKPLRANADKLISYFLDYHKSNESQVDPLGQLDPINFIGDKNIQKLLRKAYLLAKRKTDSYWQHRVTDAAIIENHDRRDDEDVL